MDQRTIGLKDAAEAFVDYLLEKMHLEVEANEEEISIKCEIEVPKFTMYCKRKIHGVEY